MEVICLEDNAFYVLIDKVVERIKEALKINQDKWISAAEAMHKFRITSKTTLRKYRDEGKIRFSQHEKKSILYDAESIDEYLEAQANNTF